MKLTITGIPLNRSKLITVKYPPNNHATWVQRMKKQGKLTRLTVTFAAVISMVFLFANTATAENKYGAREPRTCADTKAPATGPITAALAQKYLNSQMESYSGNDLWLVENVKVEVGGGVPYTPNLGSFQEIDVKVPLYPIRGSYLQYQCHTITPYTPAGKNCSCYTHNKAKGYCYKTTFGDWTCFMADPTAATNDANIRTQIAAPTTAR